MPEVSVVTSSDFAPDGDKETAAAQQDAWPPQVLAPTEAPTDPWFTSELARRNLPGDDLRSAKGILLCLVLGVGLWVSIVAIVLR